MNATVSDTELTETIVAAIRSLDRSGIGCVNLGHHTFDRIPCSPRKLYAVARKVAASLGYEYHGAEYRPSGNRAFQKNHRRGQYSKPRLIRPNGGTR